jgi:hypothetical protein
MQTSEERPVPFLNQDAIAVTMIRAVIGDHQSRVGLADDDAPKPGTKRTPWQTIMSHRRTIASFIQRVGMPLNVNDTRISSTGSAANIVAGQLKI